MANEKIEALLERIAVALERLVEQAHQGGTVAEVTERQPF